jgi:type IV pilus assembly protein PilV
MADRMRANRLGLDSGCYDSLGDSGTDSACFSEGDTDPGCIESGCTPEQMAQYDSWQWNTDNARLLPEGVGTVSLKSSDSGIYTITIAWNDDRDPGTEADSFIFELQP